MDVEIYVFESFQIFRERRLILYKNCVIFIQYISSLNYVHVVCTLFLPSNQNNFYRSSLS